MSTIDIKSLLGIDADTIEVLMNRAAALYSEGQFEAMRKTLNGVIALSPDDPRPHTLIGSSYLLEGRDRDADTAYQAAFERDPSDPYTLVALGELKLRALDLKSAVTYFEKLFTSTTDHTHPARLRGQALVREYHAKLGGS